MAGKSPTVDFACLHNMDIHELLINSTSTSPLFQTGYPSFFAVMLIAGSAFVAYLLKSPIP
jgi:hypothetical protein